MNALFLSLERLRVDLERQVRYRSLRLIVLYKIRWSKTEWPTDYEPAVNKPTKLVDYLVMNALFLSLERLRVNLERQIKYHSLRLTVLYLSLIHI